MTRPTNVPRRPIRVKKTNNGTASRMLGNR
jgi:hypothetical protein